VRTKKRVITPGSRTLAQNMGGKRRQEQDGDGRDGDPSGQETVLGRSASARSTRGTERTRRRPPPCLSIVGEAPLWPPRKSPADYAHCG